MTSKLTGEGGGEVKKKPLQFSAITGTFEHKHENKSCAACPEDHF